MPSATLPILPTAFATCLFDQDCDEDGKRRVEILVQFAGDIVNSAEAKVSISDLDPVDRVAVFPSGQGRVFRQEFHLAPGTYAPAVKIDYQWVSSHSAIYNQPYSVTVSPSPLIVPACGTMVCPRIAGEIQVATFCARAGARRVTLLSKFSPAIPQGMNAVLVVEGLGSPQRLTLPTTSALLSQETQVELPPGTYQAYARLELPGTKCGNSEFRSSSFLVRECPCPDIAIIGPGNIDCIGPGHHATARLQANFPSEVRGNIRWTLRDGNGLLIDEKSGYEERSYSHEFASAGSYTVILLLEVQGCSPAATAKTITVRECQCPGLEQTLRVATPPWDECSRGFEAVVSNPDRAGPLSFEWDFGDGSPRTRTTQPNTIHRYASDGDFQAVVFMTAESSPSCAMTISTADVQIRCREPVKPRTGMSAGCGFLMGAALLFVLLGIIGAYVSCESANPYVIAGTIVSGALGFGLLALWAWKCGEGNCDWLRWVHELLWWAKWVQGGLALLVGLFGGLGIFCGGLMALVNFAYLDQLDEVVMSIAKGVSCRTEAWK